MKKKRKYTRKLNGIDVIPAYYQGEIKRIIEWRKSLGLPDDSKERWERAIRYWQGR